MKVLERLKGFFRVDCLARSVQTSEKCCTSHQPCNKRTVCTGLKKKEKKRAKAKTALALPWSQFAYVYLNPPSFRIQGRRASTLLPHPHGYGGLRSILLGFPVCITTKSFVLSLLSISQASQQQETHIPNRNLNPQLLPRPWDVREDL